jgi:hypothetical protein
MLRTADPAAAKLALVMGETVFGREIPTDPAKTIKIGYNVRCASFVHEAYGAVHWVSRLFWLSGRSEMME